MCRWFDPSRSHFMERRVFSGIRATGRLHLGNYLGAVKGMLALQDKYDCLFAVVDLHTLTTPFDARTLQQDIHEVVLDYLAAGLDPSTSSGQAPKCHLMIQSQVPAHLELAYLLSTIYPVSRLEDLPTYKDKKLQHPDYVNLGLLYYPVLMAADILIYKAELVPVGIDQEPHLEVTREIARKFNRMFPSTGSGQVTFPEPQRFATKEEYVPSLLGSGKMSKSVEGSYLLLTDDLETIKKRLAAVPTDSGKADQVPREGGVANLLTLVEIFLGKAKREEYEKAYQTTGVRYQELKDKLAQAIAEELVPIQKRRKDYAARPEFVEGILEEGREYATKLAEETLSEVKKKMGLRA